MRVSTEMGTRATGFTAVIRLVNCYLATHVNEDEIRFISKHPESDIKVAQATAKLFAETNNILYDDTSFELSQPIITVMKDGEKWYPAELHPDRITLLLSFNSLDTGGGQQETINTANAIALSRNGDCFPSLGISLAK